MSINLEKECEGLNPSPVARECLVRIMKMLITGRQPPPGYGSCAKSATILFLRHSWVLSQTDKEKPR